jgi:opacity protein-like surface antigen
MKSTLARYARSATVSVFVLASLTWAPPVSAQGFGIGGRFAWVTGDDDVDQDSVRFFGGQVRLLGRRYGLEVSIDRHSESFELLNQKLTETPIQASLLLRLGGGSVSPFLLAGPGWYRSTLAPLDSSDDDDDDVNSTEFGWHAGFGLEILPNRHFGIHGDYRYTFLDFTDDDDEGFIGGLLPGHRGSMWTVGATIYF